MNNQHTPKYYRIKEWLLEYARNEGLKAGDMLPSENELAAMHRVTKVTAARALNELVADGIACRVQGKGTFFVSADRISESEIIIYLPYKALDIYFADPLIHSLVSSIEKEGHISTIKYFDGTGMLTPGKEINNAKAIIVVAHYDRQCINKEALGNINIPIVYYGYHPEENAGIVYPGDVDGTDKAMEYLVGMGHREIFFIKGYDNHIASMRKLEAYTRFMQDRGLEPRAFDSTFTESAGYEVTVDFLERKQVPTAIVCANDFLALGALKAVRHKGFGIPEDISVLGCGNFIFSSLSRPSLTTVEMHFDTIGMKLGELAIRKIDENTVGNREQVTVPADLIIRDSTGPAKCMRTENKRGGKQLATLSS